MNQKPIHAKTSLIIATIGAIFSFAINAGAATWYADMVGGGTGTSASSPLLPRYAINRASDGDTIYLAAGNYVLGSTYGMSLGVNGKALTIVGAGVSSTNISMGCTGISIQNYADVEFSDMTIFNGASGNISVTYSSLSMDTVEMNNFTMPSAVVITHESYGHFYNCTFDHNVTGIATTSDSESDVENCTFTDNTSRGVFLAHTSSTTVAASTFIGNYVGVGLQCSTDDTYAFISTNLFINNGWGVSTLGSGCEAYVTAEKNLFDGNTTVGLVSSSPGSESVIEANMVQNNGIGLYLGGTEDEVVNNVVHHNIGNGIQSNGSDGIIAFNTVVQNGGDGISVHNSDTSLIVNNSVTENNYNGIVAVSSSSAEVGFNNSFYNGTNYGGAFTSLSGNMSVDPRYVGGLNFNLQPTSPNIAAANGTYYQAKRDFRGISRLPAPSDIGAYEF